MCFPFRIYERKFFLNSSSSYFKQLLLPIEADGILVDTKTILKKLLETFKTFFQQNIEI